VAVVVAAAVVVVTLAAELAATAIKRTRLILVHARLGYQPRFFAF
jgi:hypothetical protein